MASIKRQVSLDELLKLNCPKHGCKELRKKYSKLSAENVRLQLSLTSMKEISEHLSAREVTVSEQKKIIEDLREKVEIAQVQASLNKADFEEERRDRIKAHSKFADLETKAAQTKSKLEDERWASEQYAAKLQEEMLKKLESHKQELAHCEKKIDHLKEENTKLKLEKELKKANDGLKVKPKSQSGIKVHKKESGDLMAQVEVLVDERKVSDLQLKREIEQLNIKLADASKTSESLRQRNTQLRNNMDLIQGWIQSLKEERDDAIRQLHAGATAGDELAPYRLHFQDPLPANRQVGSGCYGTVYAVEIDGVQCIAKRVQDILLGERGQEAVGRDQRRAMEEMFRRECILLSKIRHPNIVQFMGVRYGRDMYDLTLVMERLPMDLQWCLERCQADGFFISLSIRFSILVDVTYGLLHLHNRSILHRDLAASNILLTSNLRAKIADLGVSRIDHSRYSQKLSKTPGTMGYMPPEALKDNPEYNIKLDIYSFGVLALFVALQEFPEFSWEHVPDFVMAKGESELYKRRRWMSKIGERHFLYPLIHQCLQDNSTARPSTMELNAMMKELSAKFPRRLQDINGMVENLCMLGMSDSLI